MESLSGSLWKLKSGISGSYWKKKFVYADEQKLLHWQQETKEEAKNELPKHGFILFRCSVVEEPSLKAYAFRITDTIDRRTVVFATDGITEFEKWMKLLKRKHEDPSKISFRSKKGENPAPSANEEAKKAEAATDAPERRSPSDVIISFFLNNDPMELKERYISCRQLQRLLWELFPNFNCFVAKYIFATVQTKNGFISYSEFMSWWQQYQDDSYFRFESSLSILIQKVRPIVRRPMNIHIAYPPIHLACMVNAHDIPSKFKSASSILSEFIPSIQDMSLPSSGVGHRWIEMFSKIWNVSSATSNYDSIDSLYSVAYDSSVLQNQALEGTKLLIEQLSLPLHLRKFKTITIPNSDKDGLREEVFLLDGLIFRIISTSQSDLEFVWDTSIFKSLKDEFNLQCAVQRAIATYNFHRESLTANYIGKIDTSKQLSISNAVPSMETNFAGLLRSLPQFLVDYCGFRVQVMAPLNNFGDDNLVWTSSQPNEPIKLIKSNLINAVNLQVSLRAIKSLAMSSVNVNEANNNTFISAHEYSPNCIYLFSSLGDFSRIVPRNKLLRIDAAKLSGSILDAVEALNNGTYLPLDSFTLKSFLRSKGISCCLMGVLFELCTIAEIKRLLLAESIARVCKILLGHILRKIIRNGCEQTVAAVHRKRSRDIDYYHHQTDTLKAQRNAIVGFFNITLGSSQLSTEFWRGESHRGLLYEKFGIKLSDEIKSEFIHFPQLFNCMQYHCGMTFQDHASYQFGEVLTVNPILMSDLLHISPSNQKFSHNIGSLSITGAETDIGQVLLASGMIDEAANFLELQYEINNRLLNPQATSSPKIVAELAHLTYILSVAEYLRGNNEVAEALLSRYIASNSFYLPVSGRMMTLLSLVKMKLGLYSEAIQIFDVASDVYSYCLGPYHTLMAIHMCSLADAYRQKNNITQCRIMMTLAYDICQISRGQNHIITATYAKKLATCCLEQNIIPEALHLLRKAIPIIEYVDTQSYLECLFLKAICYTERNELQKAISVCENILTFNYPSTKIFSIECIASFILLSDIHFRLKDSQVSKAYLRKALDSLRSGHAFGLNIGMTVSNLTLKILNTFFSSQSFQIRILLTNEYDYNLKKKTAAATTTTATTTATTATTATKKEKIPHDFAVDVIDNLWTQYADVYFGSILQCIPASSTDNLGELDEEISNKIALLMKLIQ